MSSPLCLSQLIKHVIGHPEDIKTCSKRSQSVKLWRRHVAVPELTSWRWQLASLSALLRRPCAEPITEATNNDCFFHHLLLQSLFFSSSDWLMFEVCLSGDGRKSIDGHIISSHLTGWQLTCQPGCRVSITADRSSSWKTPATDSQTNADCTHEH